MNASNSIRNLAVYTTIYPGVTEFLPDWYRSIKAQTDGDFRLWIGLDGLDAVTVQQLAGGPVAATYVPAEPADTPASLRQRALTRIVSTCDAVVLVDSDDILHPSRVAAARAALAAADLSGCALRLVDRQGRDLQSCFSLPSGMKPEEVLPRQNIFGMSNTAYRSALLQRCLPIPADAVLVDWFLATKAWLLGAKLAFDPVVRMDYRRYGLNTASVGFPVSVEQVIRDTERVRRHFQFVLAVDPVGLVGARLAQLQRAAASVEAFYRQIVQDPNRLLRYVSSLNNLNPAPVWWSSVAHPALESLWQPVETNHEHH